MLRLLAINLLVWGVLSALGAASSYSATLRNGVGNSYAVDFFAWWRCTMAQVLLCCLLHALFTRWPALVARPRHIALVFAATLLLFFPLDVMYETTYNVLLAGRALRPEHMLRALASIHKFDWFVDVALTCGSIGAQVALSIWRQGKADQQALAQAETDNLRLKLELEQQRMLALRGQLEPHFMFNALNAISALVRSDDKKVALAGINRLSALLRYALTAADRDWVSIDEELAFVRDYLALQQLRYGARLRVSIEGVDARIGAIACPPLLLQPLVENALRHDLDCHTEASDIRLRFHIEQRQLAVSISNPLAAAHGSNPGLGLGLRHTEASLQLAFGPLAALRTSVDAGRFRVELRLPLAASA
ncbi:sensor histidine kinase [Janthinobacterium sp. BJB412]|nr:sensor histidine kinase [Janthinobacterium sp. BJB412]